MSSQGPCWTNAIAVGSPGSALAFHDILVLSTIPMKGPLISIVMPAYNAVTTLPGAVLGVVNQRYWNWELIIVDDGSSDNPEPAIKQFDDKRIRLIRLARNRGLASALNVGIASAEGRYIARMDADDYMEDWRLGDQMRHMMLHGLAICGTGAEKFGLETGSIRSPKWGPDIVNSFLMGNPFVHPTMMLDREKLDGQLRYDQEFRCEEDYELWARVVTAGNCANLDYDSIKYRVASNSNANHPQKKRLNRIALQRFSERMGVADLVPIDEASELQLAGYVSEPGWRKLVAYARHAEMKGTPKLGWVHGALLDLGTFDKFFAWLNEIRRFSPYKYGDAA